MPEASKWDMERAIELVKLSASNDEVVNIIGVGMKELTHERKWELERHRSERSVRVKAKLYELALKGNTRALLRLMGDEGKK